MANVYSFQILSIFSYDMAYQFMKQRGLVQHLFNIKNISSLLLYIYINELQCLLSYHNTKHKHQFEIFPYISVLLLLSVVKFLHL